MAQNPAGHAKDLGERVETFASSLANVVAGFILAVLLILGGLALAYYLGREANACGWQMPLLAKHGMCWMAAGLGAVIVAALLTMGVVLLQFSRALSSARTEICTSGFRYYEGQSCDEILWTDVVTIHEVVTYERPPLLKGPARLLIPKMASRSYEVLTKAGKTLHFDANRIRGLARFARLLRRQATQHNVAWEKVERHE